jgi:S1-C subfamily serine protease
MSEIYRKVAETRRQFDEAHRARWSRSWVQMAGTLRTQIGFIALTLIVACSGDDGYKPTYSQRSATGSECPTGGTVLVVDGEAQIAACNGARGEMGLSGSPGVMGPAGIVGPSGEDAEDFSSMTMALAPFAESLVGVLCCETADPADPDNLCAWGSGVKTALTRVSTARHVVDGMTVCEIVSGTSTTVLGTSTEILVSAEADLAQIEVASLSGPVVPSVVAYQPELGEPVIVVGQPDTALGPAYENQYTFGHVTAKRLDDTLNAAEITDWPNAFSIDAVAWHGNSGSAVFNEDGVCIGLLVGGLNGGPENAGPDTSIVLPFPSGS